MAPTPRYAIMFVYVRTENPELVQLYKDHIAKHNEHVSADPYPNSGFDLFVPERTVFPADDTKSQLINMEIKVEMYDADFAPEEGPGDITAYYMYPRSSLSKTPLLLANHVGIIDQGYRGFLMGAFRSLSKEEYVVEKHTRLLQICHPTLRPILVKWVENEADLTKSQRDSGGFGSTGLIGLSPSS